jgi:hypothetical protein
MKYTRTTEISIEITPQLIAELNERYGQYDDIDYNTDLDALEAVLDELYDEIAYEHPELSAIEETSGLVGIKYPD